MKKIWDNYNSLNELKNDSLENIYAKTQIPINLITKIKEKIGELVLWILLVMHYGERGFLDIENFIGTLYFLEFSQT